MYQQVSAVCHKWGREVFGDRDQYIGECIKDNQGAIKAAAGILISVVLMLGWAVVMFIYHCICEGLEFEFYIWLIAMFEGRYAEEDEEEQWSQDETQPLYGGDEPCDEVGAYPEYPSDYVKAKDCL